MSKNSKYRKPAMVIPVDPFEVEVYKSDKVGFDGNKVVVTIANKAVRYEFSPASEPYWFILHSVGDVDALKAFLSMLTLTAEKLSSDDEFLADISKIIDKSIKRKLKEARDAAKSVTEHDEEAAQLFMAGVAKEIDKRNQKRK